MMTTMSLSKSVNLTTNTVYTRPGDAASSQTADNPLVGVMRANMCGASFERVLDIVRNT